MKIQCDVCNTDEASVYCTADEAALCPRCDHRVHHANKLASKHHRFSLLSPSSPKELPLCEICQEKRGFLFCQQDRTILCRDCDVPIHTANEHTKKHDRFLLTGVKLSASSAVYTSPVPNFDLDDTVPDFPNPTVAASQPKRVPERSDFSVGNNKVGNSNPLVHQGNTSTRSISEYLMETLPGWHFEDFLDSCSASFGFYKSDDEGLLPMKDNDDDESLGIWVPEEPPPLDYYSTTQSSAQINNGFLKEPLHVKQSKKRWSDDDVFAVPEISPPSTAAKRSRHFHYSSF